jgi:hypothetical protein
MNKHSTSDLYLDHWVSVCTVLTASYMLSTTIQLFFCTAISSFASNDEANTWLFLKYLSTRPNVFRDSEKIKLRGTPIQVYNISGLFSLDWIQHNCYLRIMWNRQQTNEMIFFVCCFGQIHRVYNSDKKKEPAKHQRIV